MVAFCDIFDQGIKTSSLILITEDDDKVQFSVQRVKGVLGVTKDSCDANSSTNESDLLKRELEIRIKPRTGSTHVVPIVQR